MKLLNNVTNLHGNPITVTEIFFGDLKDECQKRVLKTLGVNSPEEANLDTFPLFVLEIDRTEEDT